MKKNISKKSPERQGKFPSISRSFTEKPLITVGMGTILLGLVVLIAIQSVDVYSMLWERDRVDKETEKISQEMAFWEDVVEKYPDYPGGFLKLALLSYQLKEDEKAHQYVARALFLNPNFQEAKELKLLLENEQKKD